MRCVGKRLKIMVASEQIKNPEIFPGFLFEIVKIGESATLIFYERSELEIRKYSGGGI